MAKFIPVVFAFNLFVTGSALAGPMCATGTLASYISLGTTGCDLGGGTLSSFQTLPAITGALAIPASDITITPVQSTGMLGIDVQITSTAAAGQLREALLGYMLMAPSITSSMVTLSGTSVSGGGVVTDIQNYCKGGSFLPNDVTGCGGSDGVLVVLNSGTDKHTFPVTAKLSIVHDFTLDAGGGGTASGGLVSDRFEVQADSSAVPEPQTYTMMVAGLTLLGLKSRSRRAGK